jgi:glycosyltransferase involved in cell wall biosynthesis
MALFTVFTGTYNSQDVIDRVFKSVLQQEYKDFEWIIIDDNSSDDTPELVSAFIEQHPKLDIRLIQHQANTGVATSRKEALQLATGRYFVTWDHDDEQSPEQLSVFQKLWQQYDTETVGNIFAKMQDQQGNTLGPLFPENPYLSDYIQLHNRYLRGNKSKGRVIEHHVCVKTAVYLEVLDYYEKRPELTDGRNPNGGDIWSMLAYLGYQTICTNNTVRKYYIDELGRVSMTSHMKRKDGAKRILYNKLLWVNYFDTRLPITELPMKLRNIFAAAMYAYLSKTRFSSLLHKIRPTLAKLALMILWLPATIVAKRYE